MPSQTAETLKQQHFRVIYNICTYQYLFCCNYFQKKRCSDRSIKVFMTMDLQANGPIRLRNKWLVSGSATIELEPVRGDVKNQFWFEIAQSRRPLPKRQKLFDKNLLWSGTSYLILVVGTYVQHPKLPLSERRSLLFIMLIQLFCPF